jgi:hypothetical protein
LISILDSLAEAVPRIPRKAWHEKKHVVLRRILSPERRAEIRKYVQFIESRKGQTGRYTDRIPGYEGLTREEWRSVHRRLWEDTRILKSWGLDPTKRVKRGEL